METCGDIRGAAGAPPQRLWLLAGWLAWLALVVGAMQALHGYHYTPGAVSARRASHWPTAHSLGPAAEPKGRWALVAFLHPMCPCSRATLAEIAKLAGKLRDSAAIVLVFTSDAATAQASPLWEEADAIPGARRVVSQAAAVEFGAATSGEVFLFDPKGSVAFAGGITPARGTQGENAGSLAIAELLRNPTSSRFTTAVFGCPIGSTP